MHVLSVFGDWVQRACSALRDSHEPALSYDNALLTTARLPAFGGGRGEHSHRRDRRRCSSSTAARPITAVARVASRYSPRVSPAIPSLRTAGGAFAGPGTQ